MKKVLFVLSGNLSTTPRALKTILSLPEGYTCDIVLINRHPVWSEKDSEIIKRHNLNVTAANLGRRPFLPWLKATLIEKLSQKVYPFLKRNKSINAFASDKSSIVLWNYLQNLENADYDLILGYSSGSLFPVWKLSGKWNVPFLFDVEDYHPGEAIATDNDHEIKRREYLMQSLLPEAAMITSASPLIGKHTLKLINGHRKHRVVLNGFPLDEFRVPEVSDSSKIQEQDIKMVWFSQKVGFGRGLEQFLKALSAVQFEETAIKLELTFIGEMDPVFKREVLEPYISGTNPDFVKITEIPSLPQKDLHALLANFDVGLALEFNTSDFNRQLCITNKIMAYSQAGLYILATDTPAQADFIERHPDIGLLCGQSESEIKKGIDQLLGNYERIKIKKPERYKIGKELSWDLGGGTFPELIKNL